MVKRIVLAASMMAIAAMTSEAFPYSKRVRLASSHQWRQGRRARIGTMAGRNGTIEPILFPIGASSDSSQMVG
jgi:hypothetical protein